MDESLDNCDTPSKEEDSPCSEQEPDEDNNKLRKEESLQETDSNTADSQSKPLPEEEEKAEEDGSDTQLDDAATKDLTKEDQTTVPDKKINEECVPENLQVKDEESPEDNQDVRAEIDKAGQEKEMVGEESTKTEKNEESENKEDQQTEDGKPEIDIKSEKEDSQTEDSGPEKENLSAQDRSPEEEDPSPEDGNTEREDLPTQDNKPEKTDSSTEDSSPEKEEGCDPEKDDPTTQGGSPEKRNMSKEGESLNLGEGNCGDKKEIEITKDSTDIAQVDSEGDCSQGKQSIGLKEGRPELRESGDQGEECNGVHVQASGTGD